MDFNFFEEDDFFSSSNDKTETVTTETVTTENGFSFGFDDQYIDDGSEPEPVVEAKKSAKKPAAKKSVKKSADFDIPAGTQVVGPAFSTVVEEKTTASALIVELINAGYYEAGVTGLEPVLEEGSVFFVKAITFEQNLLTSSRNGDELFPFDTVNSIKVGHGGKTTELSLDNFEGMDIDDISISDIKEKVCEIYPEWKDSTLVLDPETGYGTISGMLPVVIKDDFVDVKIGEEDATFDIADEDKKLSAVISMVVKHLQDKNFKTDASHVRLEKIGTGYCAGFTADAKKVKSIKRQTFEKKSAVKGKRKEIKFDIAEPLTVRVGFNGRTFDVSQATSFTDEVGEVVSFSDKIKVLESELISFLAYHYKVFKNNRSVSFVPDHDNPHCITAVIDSGIGG